MSNDDPQTPAARLIGRFGAQCLADWSGRHISRVHAWAWPPSRGGTGGVVPVRVRQAIIEGVARDLQQTLTYADFEPREGEVYLIGGAA